jgi:Mg2+-importing ATPase
MGQQAPAQVLAQLGSTAAGLDEQEAERRRRLYGANEIPRQKSPSWPEQLLASIRNPLVVLLTALAAISLVSGEAESGLIILAIVVFSVFLRFSQDFRSSKAVDGLRELVHTTATVSRPQPQQLAGDRTTALNRELDQELDLELNRGLDSGWKPNQGEPHLNLCRSLELGLRKEVPIADLVPGDVINLSAGDMVPADGRLLDSKDLFVSQASLSGEALPVEKHVTTSDLTCASPNPLDLESLCFLGTAVVSGTASMVVVQTGAHTILGSIAEGVMVPKSSTGFDRGVNDVSALLMRFMLVMAPSVFLINGLLKGNWGEAFSSPSLWR